MSREAASKVTFLPVARHPHATRSRTTPVREHTAPGTAGGWRLLRGALGGAAATTLAVGAHCMAGGGPPTWTSVVCLALLLGTVSTWLSGVRWTFPRLLGLFVVAEAGMHAVFVGAEPVLAHSGGDPTHHHMSSAGSLATEQATALLPSTPGMVTGHLVAAAVTALLLSRADALLGGVLDALALRLLRLLEAAPTLVGGPQPVPVPVLDLPRQRAALDVRRPRGPPR
jgi:hypothetical protein